MNVLEAHASFAADVEQAVADWQETPERFWSKVDKQGPVPAERPDLGPCWIWIAAKTSRGYGNFTVGGRSGRNHTAHRFAYELANGAVADGLDLDHLCRVRACVNPTHLEPVTRRENLLRGETIVARNSAKTHCPHGHEYTPENTYVRDGSRNCRQCRRQRERAYYAARRLVASIEQTVRVHQPPADGSTPSRPLNQRVALGLDGLLNPHTSTGRGANPDQ